MAIPVLEPIRKVIEPEKSVVIPCPARQLGPLHHALSLFGPPFAGAPLIAESHDALGGSSHAGDDEAGARIPGR